MSKSTIVPVQRAAGQDVFVIMFKTGMFSPWRVWAVYNNNKSTQGKMDAHIQTLRTIYPKYKFTTTKHALQRKFDY